MKKLFYIDYPQEHVEGQAHTYRCAFCKVITTTINGSLEGHLASCEYRKNLERAGYEKNMLVGSTTTATSDEVD
jgi:hypothetical protein